MKGYTIQHSIDLLEKAVDGGTGGASTAADVSYDNTGSGLTADDVQEAIDELNTAIGSVTAADVSYDNTGSGLTADDVQEAIDEIGANTGVHYSITERVIGKFGDEDLYGVMVDCGAMPNNSSKNVAHGITNIKFIYTVRGIMNNPTSGLFIPIPSTTSAAASAPHLTLWADSTNVTIGSNADASAYSQTWVWLEYTKTAPVSSTRSKKTKKEE